MRPISSLRAAVVGTGFIGAVHLEALRRLDVGIAGILGSTPARGASKAAEWRVRSYDDYEQILTDPDVDVVHITSPNELHFEQAFSALNAGKHVICEKPLALTPPETAELSSLATRSGLVAAVNFNIRFYPQVHEMRARIAAGLVGKPFLISGSYQQDWLLKDTDWNWRVEPQRGGRLRVVGDVGSHWFDLASFVTGQRITEVFADLATFVPTRYQPRDEVPTFAAAVGETRPFLVTSEDAACILVRFESGARGTLLVSQVSAGRKNSVTLEVGGSTASLAWRGERPDELWIGHRDGPNELLLRDPGLLQPAAAEIAGLPGGHAEGFENGFKALYASVYADVAGGGPRLTPPYATFADGHREALLVDAVARSAETGTWVAVGDSR